VDLITNAYQIGLRIESVCLQMAVAELNLLSNKRLDDIKANFYSGVLSISSICAYLNKDIGLI
jgi:hypothetical protein